MGKFAFACFSIVAALVGSTPARASQDIPCETLLIEHLGATGDRFLPWDSLPKDLSKRPSAVILVRLPLADLKVTRLQRLGLPNSIPVEVPEAFLLIADGYLNAILRGETPALQEAHRDLAQRFQNLQYQIMDGTQPVDETEIALLRDTSRGLLRQILSEFARLSGFSMRSRNGLQKSATAVARGEAISEEQFEFFQKDFEAIDFGVFDGDQLAGISTEGSGSRFVIDRFLKLWRSLTRTIDAEYRGGPLTEQDFERTLGILRRSAGRRPRSKWNTSPESLAIIEQIRTLTPGQHFAGPGALENALEAVLRSRARPDEVPEALKKLKEIAFLSSDLNNSRIPGAAQRRLFAGWELVNSYRTAGRDDSKEPESFGVPL